MPRITPDPEQLRQQYQAEGFSVVVQSACRLRMVDEDPFTYIGKCVFSEVGEIDEELQGEFTGELPRANLPEHSDIRTGLYFYLTWLRTNDDQLIPAIDTRRFSAPPLRSRMHEHTKKLHRYD